MASPAIHMLTTKLIITNKTALQKKYGDQHQALLDDLASLQAADAGRQLSTRVIFLDDAAQMQACQSTPVTEVTDEAQHKKAIDDLYRFYSPGYIMLVGAQDIVPFQRLKNLLKDNDPDSLIPSDLPYACDAPYDTDPGKFIAPTRVVGRVPDIPGVADPSYLRSLIKDILDTVSQPAQVYRPYFAASTFDWQDSTQNSLQNIFGDKNGLLVFPGTDALNGSNWSTQMMPKTHFINCHGAIYNPGYYGQKAADFPLAMRSDTITAKLSTGTIVAAECCYGGQLYDPQKNAAKLMSMANSYLLNHAIAFVGASNIAYGPPTGQGLADLLTQFFLINVLNGASTGRALLEARQRFLHEMGPTLDPFELKTAAQFYLLGDPSLQPVINDRDPSTDGVTQPFVNTLQNRRDNLEARGKMLDDFLSPPEHTTDTHATDPALEAAIHSLLGVKQFTSPPPAKTFISQRKSQLTNTASGASIPSVKFHVFSESAVSGERTSTKVLVVKEKNNQILGYREYVSR
ncbi:hypothetical protein HGH92_04335 [Chitinophaga varians]|uniref:Gingipain domain-containing protein n=1 Tax=Chitinophaga varians TaxID=2202339 RepID=A0A847RRK2_9BACT|nr:C25 family cysteine peptidase [Chitinophaga varians]NLR63528.1 hypothetical protein [Chitinophaga varians]